MEATILQTFWIITLFLRLLYLFSSLIFNRSGKPNSDKRPDEVTVRFYQFRKRLTPLFFVMLVETIWFTWTTYSCYCSHGHTVGYTHYLIDHLFGEHKKDTTGSTNVLLAYFMLLFHVGRRFEECLRINIFSHRQVRSFPNTVFQFVSAVFIALSIVADGPSLDGNLTKRCFSYNEFSLRMFIGVMFFIVASILQRKVICSFVKLRKNKAGHIVTTSYKLPKDQLLFQYISCPHFLAEIIIYASIGFVLGQSKTWWLVVGNVFVREFDAAWHTHKFYKEKFPKEMPIGSKAIFPLLI